ncbi:uncharacterized protein LOC129290353 [Prosopis cineraria]|uniref:uncharacterized protein LOC129290353 n=1 Tax=Prosopis cineraria TaxID=364024 RepID=UPI0024102777|nr:uncharacterized protein LOC129290353 [Prosopis cineraria]XP_054783076.1 uncharacterized protein LOC129290353 [Prosopis cineraria]
MIMAAYEAMEQISLTLVVDKTTNKVLYAEAGNGFLDILLSFFTMPLGTISTLVRKKSSVQPCKFGCIGSLHCSAENLDSKSFLNYDEGKDDLLDLEPAEAWGDDVQFNSLHYIVYDDLKVVRCDVNTTLEILRNFGTEHVPVRLTADITKKEALDLLKLSLYSETPLTDLFLRKEPHIKNCIQAQPQLKINVSEMQDREGKKMELKLKVIISKSKSKIVFAEADHKFVNQLYSFLLIPLGAVERLAQGNTGFVCIDNLYKSVIDLRETIKDNDPYSGATSFSNALRTFIDPCIGREIKRLMLPVPINHSKRPSEYLGYMKQETMYMVSDNLWVQPFSSLAALSVLHESQVFADDLEVKDICIGVNEVLGILNAAVTSSSALTRGLSSFIRNSKRKRSGVASNYGNLILFL